MRRQPLYPFALARINPSKKLPRTVMASTAVPPPVVLPPAVSHPPPRPPVPALSPSTLTGNEPTAPQASASLTSATTSTPRWKWKTPMTSSSTKTPYLKNPTSRAPLFSVRHLLFPYLPALPSTSFRVQPFPLAPTLRSKTYTPLTPPSALECRPIPGKRRRACKDCTCGLAQRLAAEDDAKRSAADQSLAKLRASDLAEIDFTVQGKVGSCGNCALGDAFRCDGCPYVGLPAFKPGEEVRLGVGDEGTV